MSEKTEKAKQVLLAELEKVLPDRGNAVTKTRATLRDAVCDYVFVEQARGTTLNRIIQTVKDLLRNAEMDASTASDSTRIQDDHLAEQLVDWCVEFHHAALAGKLK